MINIWERYKPVSTINPTNMPTINFTKFHLFKSGQVQPLRTRDSFIRVRVNSSQPKNGGNKAPNDNPMCKTSGCAVQLSHQE